MKNWMIQYWLTAAFGTVTAAFGWSLKYLWNRQKEQQTEQQAVKEGILALLHDRIYGAYADCESKGFATVEDLRNLEYLYRPYHNLGGNGTGTELFERVKKMPDCPAERSES